MGRRLGRVEFLASWSGGRDEDWVGGASGPAGPAAGTKTRSDGLLGRLGLMASWAGSHGQFLSGKRAAEQPF
jgi:hypothetical protein